MSNENEIALARANGRVLRMFTSSGGGGTTYTAGDGITISQENEISANVDGETIGINASGQLESLVQYMSASVSYDAVNEELHLDFSPQQQNNNP